MTNEQIHTEVTLGLALGNFEEERDPPISVLLGWHTLAWETDTREKKHFIR